jgi:hypothetical protein
VVQYSGPRPKRPADCDLDWQPVASISTRGRATIFSCAGDTLQGDYPTVGYGSTWKRGTIVCTVAKTGVTCKNRSKFGFLVSRGSIKQV